MLTLSIRLNHLFILPAGRSAGWLRIREMPLSRLRQSFNPSFEGCQHRLCPYFAFGFVALPRVLFRLFIPLGNSRGWFFAFHGLVLSTFLPPFAPPVVTRLRSMGAGLPAWFCPWLACASMAALTPAGCLAASCPGRSPAFTPSSLYFLRSVRFSTLLSTPPHGDAVTSSSRPGCVWTGWSLPLQRIMALHSARVAGQWLADEAERQRFSSGTSLAWAIRRSPLLGVSHKELRTPIRRPMESR